MRLSVLNLVLNELNVGDARESEGNKSILLPGFEPRIVDSKSTVITTSLQEKLLAFPDGVARHNVSCTYLQITHFLTFHFSISIFYTFTHTIKLKTLCSDTVQTIYHDLIQLKNRRNYTNDSHQSDTHTYIFSLVFMLYMKIYCISHFNITY